MDLGSAQAASSRRSSRKRGRDTDSLHLDVDEVKIQCEPRVLAARKRRAIEHLDTDTSIISSSARRSAVQVSESSYLATAVQSSTATPTLSHEDPVPEDCCFVCRRRGGNYAYTCVYEDGSEACRRCKKENHRCRPATDDEIAKAEARCPQCKRRGLSNCTYEDGKTSCQQCIKWNKKCGAPTKRLFNANTRSFLGIPTPEPEQSPAAPHERLLKGGNEQLISARRTPRSAVIPSRTRKTTRQSIAATVPSNIDHEADQLFKETEHLELSTRHNSPYDDSRRWTITGTQPPGSLATPKGQTGNEIAAEHRSAHLTRTSVRGSRRMAMRRRSPTPLLVQGATPDDSAAEVDVADDESADLQLITENNGAIPPSLAPVTGSEAEDEDVEHVLSLDRSSLGDVLSDAQQRITRVVDGQALRPRRRRSRPSYVDHVLSDMSDQEDENDGADDDDSDVWDPPAAEDESEVDEDEELVVVVESSSDEAEDSEDLESVDIEPEPLIASRRKSQLHGPKPGKGVDLSLPPLDNIFDITADMASRAVKLGLSDVLTRLEERPINVATMCSGTESPLLFLQMLAEALDSKGEKTLNIAHHFSAEIDATKQAYIERNFHPPTLFRDVRQLGDELATTATTAYGAEEPIPGSIDILVAGFVCKDLSSLNSKKKSVDDQGETGDTWRAIYFYAKRFRPGIVLLENVRSDKSLWDDVVSRWSRIGYEAAWIYCDTKNYYLPQTRERMYMIAINRKLHGEGVSEAVSQWRSTMEKLQRQCSSPYEAFLVDLPVSVTDHSTLSTEPDWSLCKLRYDQIRSEQRLGTRRPITQWNESGTLHPPDHANRRWYDSQSSRVYDAIDVAHLQAAQEGHDSQYKMRIWDVSQNVDRFKTGMGLMPCITPGGCDFASNRQDALSGSQTLVLQGMPLDKLHFAGETQRERQDLAGNAMSTTVIGASLIAALINGHRAFRTGLSADVHGSKSQKKPQMHNRLVQANTMVQYKCRSPDPEDVDTGRLLDHAKLSSRLCACEGNHQISDMAIRVCSQCGHTACTMCASNPRHQYGETIPRHVREQTPGEFVRTWRPRLPPRLELQKFPNLDKRLTQLQEENNGNEAYVKRIIDLNIGSQQFSISTFERCNNAWKITYHGSDARLVLSIGDKVQWFLFIDCLPGLSSNSCLRKALQSPIARAIVDNSLLDVEWEMFVPSNQAYSLQIQGSVERSRSWRNLLGLPDFQAETVPAQLRIRGNRDETAFLEGDYIRLPHCGTAEASLYKRLTQPVLYLFLEPDPIGEARDDSFVFSVDCSRKQWGDFRITPARLNSAWRPHDMSDMNEQHNVDVVHTGSWMTISTKMAALPLTTAARVLMPRTPLTGLEGECTNAISVLDATVPEELSVDNFSDFAWALEQVKAATSLGDWQSIFVGAESNCPCAPSYPNLLWSVDNAGKATPHEDRKAAATFERGIKSRCPIFHVEPTISKKRTRIQVGVNTASLAHRAKSRLIRSIDGTRPVSSDWRLVTCHTDVGPVRFQKFKLSSNAPDAPFPGPLSLEKELRGAQPRALSWMHAQEAGVPLTITEVEEAIHPFLDWRAEARAQTTIQVRGGVLADLPSFGKTVTTIALIQSEFERSSPEEVLDQNRPAAEQLPQLIDSAATLIICPPHIAMQWQTELQLFLGAEQYEDYDVRVIKDFTELKRLTVEDIQHSRVVIVSWNVLSDEDYISQLAWMTAMPEPANSSCRAFDAWMDGVSRDLPAQVSSLQTMDLSDFKHATQDLLKQRLRQPEFQAALPLKLQHGSNYQSYEAVRAASYTNKSRKYKPALKRKSSGSKSQIIPLFHMFRFNRLVVDEYHYLNDYKKIKNMFTAVSVKKICAHKRWILSGTPALANFTDIDNIASFLGVRLGRFAVGAGKRTMLEDFLVDDQTAVERFLSKTEVMSRQWHQARHERAQEFLNLFVRQNEASLEHIPCHEELRALELSAAHHAVYLELSKYLISQRMQVKRLKNKVESDRTNRLNASLSNSQTAEDALLKAALIDETGEGDVSLDSLLKKRSTQRRDIEKEISRSMRAFEWHKSKGFKGLKPADPKKAEKEENTVPKLYASFKEDIKKNAWLGDSDATMIARRLLKSAEEDTLSGGLEGLKEVPQEKRIKEAKTIMSRLRESCTELASQRRSERFIESVQQLLQALQEDMQELVPCDAEHCQKTATISDMYLASQCGHLTCKPCVMARGDDDNCVVSGCTCMVQAANLIKATDLGSSTETAAGPFGRKMQSILRLIKRLPDDDQGLVFAPNDETIAMLGEALDYYSIPYYTPSGCNSRQAAKIIEEFKESANEEAEERPKVLLLNLASETAAGVNLTNANHVIFVSPLLVESQYKYDSAMTQAIARSRRYGQEKQVHIYHFAALRTIDVDILEHRHKRTNGIATAKSTFHMPSTPLPTREKIKLVKNHQGSMALVPVSWLEDEKIATEMGISCEPEKYTSLINFSATFEDGEE